MMDVVCGNVVACGGSHGGSDGGGYDAVEMMIMMEMCGGSVMGVACDGVRRLWVPAAGGRKVAGSDGGAGYEIRESVCVCV
nr:hypothetical protein [Tanacetum cinerariifolium]